MKYEYLCGCESDFFTMPENIIAVVQLDHCVQGLTEFSQITECGKPVIAMRRIIRTPTWTVADQKAGKLPQVGSKLIYTETWDAFEFVGVIAGSMRLACKDFQDGFIYFFEQSEMSPIESPEELAKRVREEWCADANKLIAADKDYRSESAIIYDALLSGELKMPEVQK